MPVEITVYGRAAPAGSKTSGVRNDGRRFVRDSSKAAGPWKRAVAEAAGREMDSRELLAGPLRLALTFVVARPLGHYGTGRNNGRVRPSAPAYPTTRPDLTKLTRAVEDALTGVVWRDDAQVVLQTIAKVYGEPARVHVTVTPVREENP